MSRRCRVNRKCRRACKVFGKKLRAAICAHKKCRTSGRCKAWCAKKELEVEDFEEIEDFQIELVED